MAAIWVLTLGIPVLIFFICYLYFKTFSAKYWAKQNIPHLDPVFLVGNSWKANIFENFFETVTKIYVENKATKAIGYWVFSAPQLMVNDVDITKRILITDFNIFRDRGVDVNVDLEPLAGHLFFLNGKKWRNLRVRLTPTFTSGKMKLMFPTVVKCGEGLQKYLSPMAENKESVEVKDLLSRYAMDVIASCAFGLEANCLGDPNSEFSYYGKKIFAPDIMTTVAQTFAIVYPKLAKLFSIRFIPKDVSEFFLKTVEDTVEYREKNNVIRSDFLQLLIQLLRKGKVEDVDKNTIEVSEDDRDEDLVNEFSLKDAAAQCFVFFAAGFETSSSAATFALYELALNNYIQKKLQQEIDEKLEKCGLTYEAMSSMEYLDMVLQETLRKYPPVSLLQRISSEDYYIPEIKATVKKGSVFTFPIRGFQHDPEYFPNPERFDPERFAPEKNLRDSPAFLPFGTGPRICIGNRFAMLQMKILLISILSTYNVEVTKDTPIPVKYDIFSFTPTPRGGMYLSFTRRTP